MSDAVRNKAGIVGIDHAGRERFASYGSATADGLRALALCGLPPDHPRVVAAWNWLRQNFSATVHPGHYEPGREAARNSLYYYYCHSLAEVLDRQPPSADLDIDPQEWAGQIATQLIQRQREDGSWSNPAVDVREDDPLVATAFALRALAACRSILVVESSGDIETADQRMGFKRAAVHGSSLVMLRRRSA